MTFADRQVLGLEHEIEVANRLASAGFRVSRFGQNLIDPIVQDALQRTSSPMRWLPDLIAVRPPLALWVDAKAGRTDTASFDIEQAALQAHRRHAAAGIDVVIVWPDYSWSRALDLHPRDVQPGRYNGHGSGTPFVLVRRWLTRPWPELVEV